MGQLVEGVWSDDVSRHRDGRYMRAATRFRHWVTADGSAGPSGDTGFAAEPGRYHIYVSLACPWAHRTMIFRKLKQLDGVMSLSTVEPLMLRDGWEFGAGEATRDPLMQRIQ